MPTYIVLIDKMLTSYENYVLAGNVNQAALIHTRLHNDFSTSPFPHIPALIEKRCQLAHQLLQLANLEKIYQSNAIYQELFHTLAVDIATLELEIAALYQQAGCSDSEEKYSKSAAQRKLEHQEVASLYQKVRGMKDDLKQISGDTEADRDKYARGVTGRSELFQKLSMFQEQQNRKPLAQRLMRKSHKLIQKFANRTLERDQERHQKEYEKVRKEQKEQSFYNNIADDKIVRAEMANMMRSFRFWFSRTNFVEASFKLWERIGQLTKDQENPDYAAITKTIVSRLSPAFQQKLYAELNSEKVFRIISSLHNSEGENADLVSFKDAIAHGISSLAHTLQQQLAQRDSKVPRFRYEEWQESNSKSVSEEKSVHKQLELKFQNAMAANTAALSPAPGR